MGRLLSELLARALAERKSAPKQPSTFHWNTTSGTLRVDLGDKEAVYRLLDDEVRLKLRG
jgi:hypothetical protein